MDMMKRRWIFSLEQSNRLHIYDLTRAATLEDVLILETMLKIM